ncbi:MAG: ABC transporter substrate-binding protein, partial [Thermomicrobiales bacterium]|nr:ABC transporter substrate-binding protein [Thermomicrobiales bacterium]
LAALGVLSRRAGAQASPPAATHGGAWSFTDDLGVTVTLPARPERIAADLIAAAPLWDFGIRPVAVSGWTVGTDTAWGSVDRSTPDITAIAGTSEPDLEQLIALQPDLFVTATWLSPENPYEWTFSDPEAFARVNDVVPVVAISAAGSALADTERYAKLAAALGADMAAPDLAQARADLDATLAEFKAFVEAHPDLNVLFMGVTDDAAYIANPGPLAELAMYQELGLQIVVPDIAPEEYWETLSLEQANLYPADVIFQSTREGSLSLDELQAHPTFSQHPAIKAGQTGPWNQDVIQSYQGLTVALKSVLETLQDAQDVTP